MSLLLYAGMLCDQEEILSRPVDLVDELSLHHEVGIEVEHDKAFTFVNNTHY